MQCEVCRECMSGQKEKREENKREKDGNYSYCVSLFNIGPYNRQKSLQSIEEFPKKKLRGGGRLFRVALVYVYEKLFMNKGKDNEKYENMRAGVYVKF